MESATNVNNYLRSHHCNLRQLDNIRPDCIKDILEFVNDRNKSLHRVDNLFPCQNEWAKATTAAKHGTKSSNVPHCGTMNQPGRGKTAHRCIVGLVVLGGTTAVVPLSNFLEINYITKHCSEWMRQDNRNYGEKQKYFGAYRKTCFGWGSTEYS